MAKLKLIIRLIFTVTVVTVSTQCSSSTDLNNSIRVFEEYDRFECGNYYFNLNDRFSSRLDDVSSVDDFDGKFIEISIPNKRQNDTDQMFYIVSDIWHYHFGSQNILGASLKITETGWVYHLDFPKDEKGTYLYEPSEEEKIIVQSLMNKIKNDFPESSHHFKTKYPLKDVYPPVVYVEIHQNEALAKSYFSTLSTDPCEFTILFDYVVTVLRLNHPNAVKINDIYVLQSKRQELFRIMDEYKNDYENN